jgi:hypothetical protein
MPQPLPVLERRKADNIFFDDGGDDVDHCCVWVCAELFFEGCCVCAPAECVGAFAWSCVLFVDFFVCHPDGAYLGEEFQAASEAWSAGCGDCGVDGDPGDTGSDWDAAAARGTAVVLYACRLSDWQHVRDHSLRDVCGVRDLEAQGCASAQAGHVHGKLHAAIACDFALLLFLAVDEDAHYLVGVIPLGLVVLLLIYDLYSWRRPLLVTLIGGFLFWAADPVSDMLIKTPAAQRLTVWAQNSPGK